MCRSYPTGLLLILALVLVGCSTGPRKLRDGTASTSVAQEGSALFMARNEGIVTGIRLLGPEEDSTNGVLLGFDTPWEYVAPLTYRVPAGTVVFNLHRGPLTKRGSYKFGFHAKPGEVYDLRIDEIGPPKRVTIVEIGTGRVATPRARPKRF